MRWDGWIREEVTPQELAELDRAREELYTRLVATHKPKESTMTVRAKFTVSAKRETLHWNRQNNGTLCTIELMPVMDGSDENKAFYEATPAGKIELGTLNEEAGRRFELGKSYYVDFTPAD